MLEMTFEYAIIFSFECENNGEMNSKTIVLPM